MVDSFLTNVEENGSNRDVILSMNAENTLDMASKHREGFKNNSVA